MQRSLPTLTAIALGLSLGWPAAGQQANQEEAPAADAPPAAAPETPAQDAPVQDAPAAPSADAPAGEGPAGETPGEGVQPPAAGGQAPAETAPEAEDAPETPGLPGAGEAPAAEAPMTEQAPVRASFGDWDVRCPQGTDDCALHQLGVDQDDNPVIEVSLFRLPDDAQAAALVDVLTPLGTFLPAGLTMQVDGGEPREYGFTFCAQIGCIAKIALTEEIVAAMRRGRNATVSLASIAAPDEPVEVSLSLMGFTEAFNSLEPAE